ncbi:MAG: IPTL-CTERM sorting domain-containing protein [Deltaproteobacteria bacterium]|nr:IPTL-CTERM sorting domain-containing protein [Deltaproteobacteria bacterium]
MDKRKIFFISCLFMAMICFPLTQVHAQQTVINVCSQDVPKFIDPPDSNSSIITIPDNLIITDINVKLHITHPWVGDLVVSLLSPGGTNEILFSTIGGPGDDVGTTCIPEPDCILDDDASQGIETGSPPYVGSWLAGGYLPNFHGENAQGTWTLLMSDVVLGIDGGELNCWCLEITGTPDEPIPTLNQWGLIILSIMIAASALFVIRRKRKAF